MTRASADAVLADSGRGVLTVVAGVAGIGRTTLLDQARDLARQRGAHTVSVRLSAADQAIPFSLGSWLASELNRSALAGSARSSSSSSAGVGVGAEAAWAANIILRSVVEHDDLVVLVDDAQWIDAYSSLALEMVLRELPRRGARFVFGVRTPVDSARRPTVVRAFARLRADGLARTLTLRPLAAGEVAAAVAVRTQARPHRDLSTRLRQISRGVPAALDAAAESYRRSGSLRVVGQQVYLAPPTRPARHESDDSLLTSVRSLGFPAWEVARALAVTHPVGSAAADLVGAAFDLSPGEVAAGLTALVDAGIVRRRHNGDWQFTVPVLVDALTMALGPFERRQLAATVVRASWDATIQADARFVADQIVAAGRFIDRERASTQLWRTAIDEMSVDAHAAMRWLSAAADLTGDRAVRARALVAHAGAARIAGDDTAARNSAVQVLDNYAEAVSPDELRDARLMYVLGLRGLGEVAALDAVATGGTATPARSDPVTRAAALVALGRFKQARAVLASDRGTWSESGGSAIWGDVLDAGAAALAGDPRLLTDGLDSFPGWPSETSFARRREVVAAQVRVLALLGDVPRIRRLMTDARLAAADLPATDQVLVEWRTGRWATTMDRVPLMIGSPDQVGVDGDSGLVYPVAASIQLASGRPATARATIEAGRAAGAPMGHLLDLVEARIDRTLGADEDAGARVASGLANADRSAIVAGTDELWLLHALLAVNRGDRGEAARSVAETASIARRMGTAYATLQHLLAQVVVDNDPDAAGQACDIARALDQPFTLARTLETVVRAGAGSPDLLREAYAIFGDLDALLHRCWVRTLMRGFGVAVPDRSATVVENERLLAALVGDAASNRQIATVLQTSEHSVEGKLSRLFAKTGYRSRVELATAVLSGGYRSD